MRPPRLVGHEVAVEFREMRDGGRRASRAGSAGLGIDDDWHAGSQGMRLQERQHAQQHCGRIAARDRYEINAAQLRPVDFRQAIGNR